MTTDTNTLHAVRGLVEKADRISVLTGAGISTDSGIPDFRGPNGIWTNDAEAEQYSNIDNFLLDEEHRTRSWAAYGDPIWETYEPNGAHNLLYSLYVQGKLLHIATQNIDGLHQKAGVPDEVVSELHGSLRKIECITCDFRHEMSADLINSDCPDCGDLLKPAVVYFGEQLRPGTFERSEAAAVSCDLYLVLGTTLKVWPAADLPIYAANNGASVVIVNKGSTSYDYNADYKIDHNITETLAVILT